MIIEALINLMNFFEKNNLKNEFKRQLLNEGIIDCLEAL